MKNLILLFLIITTTAYAGEEKTLTPAEQAVDTFFEAGQKIVAPPMKLLTDGVIRHIERELDKTSLGKSAKEAKETQEKYGLPKNKTSHSSPKLKTQAEREEIWNSRLCKFWWEHDPDNPEVIAKALTMQTCQM